MTAERDEAAVRAHLRALVGAPERSADSVAATEPGFVASAARWALRAKVDRKALRRLGVPRSVLDRAGIAESQASILVRWTYTDEPFGIADLARRASLSPTSVRAALLADERAGRLERVPSRERAHQWRKVPQ